VRKLLFCLLIISKVVTARELEINNDHSKILFDIDYMKLTTVQGSMKKYEGEMNISTSETDISDIKVSIKASSVDTNEPKRDFHIRGHEFFLVASYPEILFEAPGPIAIASGKKLKVKGSLTIRGIKKDVILEGSYKGKMIDPWNKENYFFELSTTINRKDFGMNWNKELDSGGYLVGDDVRVNISIQAQPKGEKTAFSTHMIPSTKGIVERDQLKRGKIKKLSTSTDPIDHSNGKKGKD
jgi:polyisoprenoid-binding protein YceI